MKHHIKKATKVVIELTTQELFNNYAQSTLDVAWESLASQLEDLLTEPLQDIHREDPDRIRKLFSGGSTMMLVGNAFELLEKYDIAEIVVTTRAGTTFVVEHSDINY